MPYVALASSLYKMGVQKKAAKDSQILAQSTARRNANMDLAQAKQSELDTAANIQAARKESAVYVSRQQTAYAASGVLADSGSPLAVQASTVGRLQQRMQQEYVNAGQREKQMRSAADAGIAYGEAQAKAIGTESTASMIRTGASALSTAYGNYQSGAFSGSGTNWSNFDKIDFTGGTDKSGFQY